MKKQSLLIFLLCCATRLFAQDYFITYIKGDVRLNDRPLKLGDKLQSLSKITSSNHKARMSLFNLDKGEFSLDFSQGKAEQAGAGTQHSELYTLVVQNFLKPYTGQGEATTRSVTNNDNFDLYYFFNSRDTSSQGNRVLLFEGQQLPVRSDKLRPTPTDKYFICKVSGSDTAAVPLTRNGNFLDINEPVASNISEESDCLMKMGYTDKFGYGEEYFPDPVTITVLSKIELREIVESYKTGLHSKYHNNTAELVAAVKDHLSTCYGQYFYRAIDGVILNDLK